MALYKALLPWLLLLVWTPASTLSESVVCRQKGDLVVVLDGSRQVGRRTWDEMIRLVQAITRMLTFDDGLARVASIVYSDRVREEFSFQRWLTPEQVARAFGRARYPGRSPTNLTAALEYLERDLFKTYKGDRSLAPNAALLVTASQPDVSREQVFRIASRLRRQGIRLFTVGIGNQVDRVELRAIATNPDEEHYFIVDRPEQLQTLTNNVTKAICRDFQLCTEAADIVFIMDTSGSVKEEWTKSLTFAKHLVGLLPVGKHNVRVAGVAYSNFAYPQFGFNETFSRSGLRRQIDDVIYHDENTNTSGALRLVRRQMFRPENGNRKGVRDVGILITDGMANREEGNLRRDSAATHRAGIQMYAIGLGPLADIGELKVIASDPDEAHLFRIAQAADGVYDNIVLKWSDCELDIVYCAKRLDLVFVLDTSGSIGDNSFRRMKNFVRTLIGNLEINTGIVRVGLIVYGDTPRVAFYLNDFRDGEDAARAILAVEFSRGTTDTAAALRLVRRGVLRDDRGDRRDAPDVVIVITDGESNRVADTLTEARLLKEAGVTSLVLGVSDPRWMRDTELLGIASIPREKNALHVRDYGSLDKVVQAIQTSICNETNECLKNPCKNRGECTNGTNEYRCACRDGTSGPDCQYECPGYYDIIFAIDSSGSVGEKDFYKMLKFFSDLVENFPFPSNPARRTRVGVLTYADHVTVHFDLNKYKTKRLIQNALYFPYTKGSTNTAEALSVIREMFTPDRGDRSNVPNVAILLTDGKSMDRDATYRQAVSTRNSGVTVIVIGVGGTVSKLELRGIASGLGDASLYMMPSFGGLPRLLEPLAVDLCNAVDDCAGRPCENGGVCIDGIGSYTCRCRRGYLGPTCARRSSKKMDVVFLIDSSGSIQRENFPLLLYFVTNVTHNLNIGPEQTRLSVITFADRARVQLNLNEYSDPQDIIHSTESIRYTGGTTNTAAAIALMRTQLLSGSNGDRLDVVNYAVLVTDGNPDDLAGTVREAIRARIAGTVLLVVGIGLNRRRALEYRGIASYPYSRTVLTVKRVADLGSISETLIDTLINDTDGCRRLSCGPGRCIPDSLNPRCDCPFPTAGLRCERRCSRQIDVALVVDVSLDVDQDFPRMLTLLRGLVNGLSFRFGGTRVALVSFDKNVQTWFLLKDYLSQLEILEALALPRKGSGTDLDRVLLTLRDSVFRESAGDRTGVRNHAVIISDGHAQSRSSVALPGVIVHTVGVGHDIDRLVLGNINRESPVMTTYTQIQSDSDLEQALTVLLDELCT